MNFNIIRARIKRNKFDFCAGEFYKDNDSDFITELKQKGFPALVGIKRNDGIYTVLGNDFIYYRSSSGIEGQIQHGDFLKNLRDITLKNGKSANYEFIEIKEDCSIWVLNIYTMNAMWNTLLLLNK